MDKPTQNALAAAHAKNLETNKTALIGTLEMQYFDNSKWQLWLSGATRMVHLGTFIAGSQSCAQAYGDRLSLVWNACAGLSDAELREIIDNNRPLEKNDGE